MKAAVVKLTDEERVRFVRWVLDSLSRDGSLSDAIPEDTHRGILEAKAAVAEMNTGERRFTSVWVRKWIDPADGDLRVPKLNRNSGLLGRVSGPFGNEPVTDTLRHEGNA